jgi:putative RNA 2'-phosphotransferase
MAAIRKCDDHGYFASDERSSDAGCPVCSNDGTVVFGSNRRTRLSKFLSGALRHSRFE